jgi:uncharacterized protein
VTTPRSGQHRAWFVDSSAFFAAFTRNDERHAAASALLRRAALAATPLVTTNFIVAETHALFLARIGREAGVAFLREIDRSLANVIRATAEDEASAREIVCRYTDKDFSLVDAISFAVMDRLRLRLAFTFDGDFERYGFERVRPSP